MIKTLFITLLLLAINCFGQVRTENDTIIKVVYKNEIENNKKPAYFINGKFFNESILW